MTTNIKVGEVYTFVGEPEQESPMGMPSGFEHEHPEAYLLRKCTVLDVFVDYLYTVVKVVFPDGETAYLEPCSLF